MAASSEIDQISNVHLKFREFIHWCMGTLWVSRRYEVSWLTWKSMAFEAKEHELKADALQVLKNSIQFKRTPYEIEVLKEMCQFFEFTGNIPEAALTKFCQNLYLDDYENDEILFFQGESIQTGSNEYFMQIDGTVEFYAVSGGVEGEQEMRSNCSLEKRKYMKSPELRSKLGKCVFVRKKGAFGEVSLITGKPRSATAIVEGSAQIVKCSQDTYKKCIMMHQREKLNMKLQDRIEFLKGMSLLQSWDAAKVSRLAYDLTTEEFGGGQMLVREGSPVVRVAVVARGEVELRVTNKDLNATLEEKKIAILRPGSLIGDIEVFYGKSKYLYSAWTNKDTGSVIYWSTVAKFQSHIFSSTKETYNFIQDSVKSRQESYKAEAEKPPSPKATSRAICIWNKTQSPKQRDTFTEHLEKHNQRNAKDKLKATVNAVRAVNAMSSPIPLRRAKSDSWAYPEGQQTKLKVYSNTARAANAFQDGANHKPNKQHFKVCGNTIRAANAFEDSFERRSRSPETSDNRSKPRLKKYGNTARGANAFHETLERRDKFDVVNDHKGLFKASANTVRGANAFTHAGKERGRKKIALRLNLEETSTTAPSFKIEDKGSSRTTSGYTATPKSMRSSGSGHETSRNSSRTSGFFHSPKVNTGEMPRTGRTYSSDSFQKASANQKEEYIRARQQNFVGNLTNRSGGSREQSPTRRGDSPSRHPAFREEYKRERRELAKHAMEIASSDTTFHQPCSAKPSSSSSTMPTPKHRTNRNHSNHTPRSLTKHNSRRRHFSANGRDLSPDHEPMHKTFSSFSEEDQRELSLTSYQRPPKAKEREHFLSSKHESTSRQRHYSENTQGELKRVASSDEVDQMDQPSSRGFFASLKESARTKETEGGSFSPKPSSRQRHYSANTQGELKRASSSDEVDQMDQPSFRGFFASLKGPKESARTTETEGGSFAPKLSSRQRHFSVNTQGELKRTVSSFSNLDTMDQSVSGSTWSEHLNYTKHQERNPSPIPGERSMPKEQQIITSPLDKTARKTKGRGHASLSPKHGDRSRNSSEAGGPEMKRVPSAPDCSKLNSKASKSGTVSHGSDIRDERPRAQSAFGRSPKNGSSGRSSGKGSPGQSNGKGSPGRSNGKGSPGRSNGKGSPGQSSARNSPGRSKGKSSSKGSKQGERAPISAILSPTNKKGRKSIKKVYIDMSGAVKDV